MFKLNEKYQIDRGILKCDYIRYLTSELSTINAPNSQSYINIPRSDAVNSLLNSLLDLNFHVFHEDNPENRYTIGYDIKLVNLGPIALFSKYNLASSNGKHIEDISHAHIASVMYKLRTSSKDSDNLSIGFDRDHGRRRRELTNNKNVKGKYHVRFMLTDIFGFAKYQQKATYGLGYILTLTRNSDNAVLNKDDAINDAKIKINTIEWLVPHYTPSLDQKSILMKQNKNKVPTELHYVEKSVCMREVKSQKVWHFQIGFQEGINIPIFIIIGFQQQDGEKS